MAFRIETRIVAIVAIAAAGAFGQTISVRHKHARHGATGELKVTGEGISFTEPGKGQKHSRVWKYTDIQQLELSAGSLKILTYEDQDWRLGRDREYVFDRLPAGFADSVYPAWRSRLDQRFVAKFAGENEPGLWRVTAKLTGTIRGSEGVVIAGNESIVYRSRSASQSRTWRYADVENIASAGPFDLSIVTREHHGSWNTGTREFRFQLKEPMPESRYNDLWRRLNRGRQSELVDRSIY